MKVHFVGAGPGDPGLITVKGAALLAAADLVLYAGSLVNPEILGYASAKARLVDSAHLDLPELVAVMAEAVRAGQQVVRLHTGDPGLFGAVQEQVEALAKQGIMSEIVPGVSSFSAAAAALGRELTLPGITQTVIITRLSGRTGVPAKEELRELARHRATMCIFLSVGMMERVVTELSVAYPPATPVAVVEKASWPQQRVVAGRLDEIADLVAEAGISRTAMILVGDFLCATAFCPSRLYDPAFSHGYRQGKDE